MLTHSFPRTIAALVATFVLALVPMATVAQIATPAAGDGVTAVASGLSAPRGFTWGPDGVLYVAQSGPGSTDKATGVASAVVKIVDGCPVPVASGLPSTFDPFRDALGPMDIQFVDDQLYVLQTATGPYGGGSPTPPMPNGIYTAGDDGSVALWLDLTAYIDAYPPEYMPGDANELAEPYRFRYEGGNDDDVDNDGFWLIDSNRGLVFFIGMDKSIDSGAPGLRVGVIGRTHQRRGGDVGETHALRRTRANARTPPAARSGPPADDGRWVANTGRASASPHRERADRA